MNIIATHEQYCQYMAVIRNYSPITLRNGRGAIRMFVQKTKIQDLEAVTFEKAQQFFLESRVERNWRSNTYIMNHKNLNVFWKWCVKQGYIKENPFLAIEKPKLEKRLPRKLTREQAGLLLETAHHMGYRYKFERHRSHAIVAMMLFTGLRRQEIMDLRLNDVNLESSTIEVIQGKGRKDRFVPINFTLRGILERYLQERTRLKRNCTFFFVALSDDSGLKVKAFIRLFLRLKQKTKLDFSPHTLRHTFATLMLEGGCDIYTLSKLMGHSDISTTTIYLSASSKLLASSIQKHPLGEI